MLMNRLADSAPDQPICYTRRTPQWIATIGGGSISITPAPDGYTTTGPDLTRTSRPISFLGTDQAQYLFPWGSNARHEAGMDTHRRWADHLGTAAAREVVDHLESATIAPPAGATPRDIVEVRLGDTAVAHLDGSEAWWVAEVGHRKCTRDALCSVCVGYGPVVDTMPGVIPAKLLPYGAKPTGAALISCNERVFGFQSEAQLGVGICVSCADRIMAGLRYRLEEAGRVRPLGRQATRHSWWYVGDEPIRDWWGWATSGLKEDEVAQLASAAESGVDAGTRLCSLMVGVNASRVVVQHWVQIPVPDLLSRLSGWAQRACLPYLGRRGSGVPSLTQMMMSLAPAVKRPQNPVHYRPEDLRSDSGWTAVYRDAAMSLLERGTVPPFLAQTAVRRIADDGQATHPRVSMIQDHYLATGS